MTISEIAEALSRGIRAYELARTKSLDFGIYVERLSLELSRHDRARGEQLKDLSMRLAALEVIGDNGQSQAILPELRQLADQIGTSAVEDRLTERM